MTHVRVAKKATNEPHTVVMVDENGTPLADRRGTAINCPSKAKKLLQELQEGQSSSLQQGSAKKTIIKSDALKGKIKVEEVELDSRLKFLYEWDKMMLPSYNNSFSEWIWETILGFHVQNREALKLNLIFQEVKSG